MIFLRLVFIALVIMLPEVSLGQHFFRLKADCTIKEKFNGGTAASLTIGKVYYDKNIKKVVYVNTFPEAEAWVIKDTMLYKIANKEVIKTTQLPFKPDYTVFHMGLNGNLQNYGLENSNFEIVDVKKENGMVITTWKAKNASIGKVVVSQKDRKLHGVAFFNSKDELMGKQLYKNYQMVKGFEFPGEIVEIYYTDEGENYKLTTYENIEIDASGENDIYDYYIPSTN